MSLHRLPQSSITIAPASPTDFLSLAAILPLAVAANPIERFMFRHDHHDSSALPLSQQWALTQFRAAQKSNAGTTTHVLKALADNEAVGFAIIRVVKGKGVGAGAENGQDAKGDLSEESDDNHTNAVESQETSGWESNADHVLNHDFCDVYVTRLKGIYERFMNGKDHAYWSTLMVLPAWQGRGVGSAIIRWAMENLHLDTMPVWLSAQPDGFHLYQKLGWTEIEDVDIDLSEWTGPNRGYGMHRTVCMLREPSRGITTPS